VHTIVFWSKNFGPFIDQGYGSQLQERGYHLFFNFTINSDSADLEPGVPPLNQRLGQLADLCDTYGPRAVNWRFDPLCFYMTAQGVLRDNLNDFQVIADHVAKSKISRCITSFMDHYPKIRRRLSSRPGFKFIDPPLAEKVKTILQMETQLADFKIRLSTCCEKDLIQALPGTSSVTPSSCIPNDVLMELYPGRVSLRRDPGQRLKAGCGCKVSSDIGSYNRQPCYHNCLFCYANPTSELK
jgi:DNA repair photolyase